jgi:hypothetical protein
MATYQVNITVQIVAQNEAMLGSKIAKLVGRRRYVKQFLIDSVYKRIDGATPTTFTMDNDTIATINDAADNAVAGELEYGVTSEDLPTLEVTITPEELATAIREPSPTTNLVTVIPHEESQAQKAEDSPNAVSVVTVDNNDDESFDNDEPHWEADDEE